MTLLWAGLYRVCTLVEFRFHNQILQSSSYKFKDGTSVLCTHVVISPLILNIRPRFFVMLRCNACSWSVSLGVGAGATRKREAEPLQLVHVVVVLLLARTAGLLAHEAADGLDGLLTAPLEH